jgi:hypothetical protein
MTLDPSQHQQMGSQVENHVSQRWIKKPQKLFFPTLSASSIVPGLNLKGYSVWTNETLTYVSVTFTWSVSFFHLLFCVF